MANKGKASKPSIKRECIASVLNIPDDSDGLKHLAANDGKSLGRISFQGIGDMLSFHDHANDDNHHSN